MLIVIANAVHFRKVHSVVRGGVMRSTAELSALATTPAGNGEEEE